MRDTNGPYTIGTYNTGRAVHIYGKRNGFTYAAYADDLTWIFKVPSS